MVTTTGNYSVTIKNTNICTVTSTATAVKVNTATIPMITKTGTTLTASTANGYQWYFNNTVINGATAKTYIPTSHGNYTVKITDINNCSATSAIYIFNGFDFRSSDNKSDSTVTNSSNTTTDNNSMITQEVKGGLTASGRVYEITNIEETNQTLGIKYQIYPNPSDGKFQLSVSGNQYSVKEVRIFNVLGEIVFQASDIQQPILNIDLSAHPAGVYSLQLQTYKGMIYRKLLKE